MIELSSYAEFKKSPPLHIELTVTTLPSLLLISGSLCRIHPGMRGYRGPDLPPTKQQAVLSADHCVLCDLKFSQAMKTSWNNSQIKANPI